MIAAAKLLIPLGVAAAVGLGFAATAKASPIEGEISEAIRNKIQAAIATGDPTTIRRVADEVERAGLTAQAKSMRDAADAIERAIDNVRPTPISPDAPIGPRGVPAPSPSEARIVVVEAGEGPFQVTQRAGINTKLFRQLRDRNIPFDADGVRRRSDGASGFLPGLDAGDRLFVPETWPDSPAFKIASVTPPATVAGDDDDERDPRDRIQRLAGRVALAISRSRKGQEDRNLIHALQTIARRKGQRATRPNGLYDAETICQLARHHGIVPPARFGDDRQPYWPTNAAPAQRTVRECLLAMAENDPVRAEEWKQAASCF